nr:putative disease resistance rpp8-like protein 4 [Quercus suber]
MAGGDRDQRRARTLTFLFTRWASRDRPGVTSASGFSFLQHNFKIIKERKDINLPTHKLTLASNLRRVEKWQKVQLMIDEGALPLLEKLGIGPSPLLKEVPSDIHNLKSLKDLIFFEMPREFVLSMQPNEGPDFWKVKHIPFVIFWYKIQGRNYKEYSLGDSKLVECLRS